MSWVETRTKTFEAGAAIAQYLRVNLSAGVLAVAGASDQEIGVMRDASFASGDKRSVILRTAQGTTPMVALAAITAGDPVYAAASGKVDASGTVLIGIACTDATANGDIIEVLRRQEASDSAAAGGTTAAAFLVDSDASTPRIELAAQPGGTGDYKGTILPPATLTANRTYTLPADQNTVLVGHNTSQLLSNKTIPVATVVVGGNAIGNANAVTEGFTLVTGADDTAAIKLPEAAAGVVVHIKNGVANKILPVFPAVNDKINNAAANAVYNIPNGGMRTFVAYNAVDWFTHPETIA